MKKIIYYYQTFKGLKDILYEGTPVTHIHLSSIHFGLDKNDIPYIHLNDNHPDDKIFDNLWKDIEKAKELGIKIILMIGGAGGGFMELFMNFDAYYKLLKDLIDNHECICGVDLDIEEYTSLENIKMLMNKIRTDFGKDFIISMAPVQSSLEYDEPGLGGFVYKDLYLSDEGKYIDYFNTQFYYDYSLEAFENIVKNGYPEEKVVVGSISSQNIDTCLDEIKKIKTEYSNFSGVFNWEYFDSKPSAGEWCELMKESINY